MKILMLTPYLPYPLMSGGQIRTYNLLKKLSKKHQITLFALIKNEEEKQYISELEKYCQKVRVFKRSSKAFTLNNILKTAFSSYPFLVIRNQADDSIEAIKQEISENNYDLIHAETFYMMPHLPECNVPVILVEQTIEYLGYESYVKKAAWFIRGILNMDVEKIHSWEKYYWQKADRLIVMSEDDRQFIANELAANSRTKKDDYLPKIDVVANGVDTAWFAEKKRQPAQYPTILSVGTFKWLPNREAVDFLVQKVWPLIKKQAQNARLLIVGSSPTQKVLDYSQKDPHIEVAAGIADIRDAFKSADVLLAPVFSGKGTRYKILEAMASGTPIVASTIAVEGLNVTNGIQVLTSNDPSKLAELTVKVLNDQALRNKLAKNGEAFVRENYDWQLISKKLDSIYQEIGSHAK